MSSQDAPEGRHIGVDSVGSLGKFLYDVRQLCHMPEIVEGISKRIRTGCWHSSFLSRATAFAGMLLQKLTSCFVLVNIEQSWAGIAWCLQCLLQGAYC
jgi:hypothetical protein